MPSYSEVDICNMALASVGAQLIRSMDEDNKRARMCSIFYPVIRDYSLARFDWPFASKFAKLKELSQDAALRFNINLDTEVPVGWYPYAKPNDCLAPRDVDPFGSRNKWCEMKSTILIPRPPETEPMLRYTAQETNTSRFSMQFINLISLGLASKIAPAVDKALAKDLYSQWLLEQNVASADDTSIGEHPEPDGNPSLDTFSDPDVALTSYIPPLGSVDYDYTK